mmetsp:Transcript_29938/g.49687  ORF Transcript_29938/g.49687 Transcript_29938/m.49687 type:complete len:212 (-) Transcript_29938:129-764(-)
MNMKDMETTDEVSHDPMGWLKEDAPLNIMSIFCTLEVSQHSKGSLNSLKRMSLKMPPSLLSVESYSKILDISVTCDTSQQLITEPYGEEEGSWRYPNISFFRSRPLEVTATPVVKPWHVASHDDRMAVGAVVSTSMPGHGSFASSKAITNATTAPIKTNMQHRRQRITAMTRFFVLSCSSSFCFSSSSLVVGLELRCCCLLLFPASISPFV